MHAVDIAEDDGVGGERRGERAAASDQQFISPNYFEKPRPVCISRDSVPRFASDSESSDVTCDTRETGSL